VKYVMVALDPWHTSTDAAPAPFAHALLTLPQWQAVQRQWPRGLAVGVALSNDEQASSVAQDLGPLTLIALHFPKWTDGRAYTQARLLRTRLRYQGELRATGDVVVDMLPLLHRTGFDAVQLRADQQQATAERVLQAFEAHYQADVHEARPLHARSA
jgi:uncharacterized protein (DUF934 family)